MSANEKELSGQCETKKECITKVIQSEMKNNSTVTMRVQKKSFSTEKNTIAVREERKITGFDGNIQEENISKMFKEMTTSSFKTSQVQSMKSHYSMKLGPEGIVSIEHSPMTSIDRYIARPSPEETESAKNLYKERLLSEILPLNEEKNPDEIETILNRIREIVCNAWEVPSHGQILGLFVCDLLRSSGILEFLLQSLEQPKLQEASGALLQQCITTENIDYIAANGLDVLVTTASSFIKNRNSTENCRIGTGILEHLFKHNEVTCSEVVRLSGLNAIIFSCAKTDKETLQHCAAALANLSICGGAENHEVLMKCKAPMWLTPLSYHEDTIIKYYSFLALAALSDRKDFESTGEVLAQAMPFLESITPEKFVDLDSAHAHGQSKYWLQCLIVLLDSKREEVQALASFHLCVEAIIEKSRGDPSLLRGLNLIRKLKNVMSGQNPVASKYATEALWLIH